MFNTKYNDHDLFPALFCQYVACTLYKNTAKQVNINRYYRTFGNRHVFRPIDFHQSIMNYAIYYLVHCHRALFFPWMLANFLIVAEGCTHKSIYQHPTTFFSAVLLLLKFDMSHADSIFLCKICLYGMVYCLCVAKKNNKIQNESLYVPCVI